MVLNILDYGADPTGSRNSFHAILSAMYALDSISVPSGNGTIYFPAGRFLVEGGPIRPFRSVHILGAGGIGRTAGPPGTFLEGSATTLVFRGESDGFFIQVGGVKIENLALIRESGTPAYANRGIYAERTIHLVNVYLARWERGIHLRGSEERGTNVNWSRIENVTAEDCGWATFVQGSDAQGCHFSSILASSCEGGIYDSSSGGNGYTDCYVENPRDRVTKQPPYYIDSYCQLRNCHAEAQHPAQIIKAQVLQFVSPAPVPITGVPASIETLAFYPPIFSGGERITLNIDGLTRLVEFDASDRTLIDIASKINSVFPDSILPTCTANVIDSSLIIRGSVPDIIGVVSIEGPEALLGSLGLPAYHGRLANGAKNNQIIGTYGTSGITFQSITDSYGYVGDTDKIEVQIASRGNSPISWQAREEETGEASEFGIIRIREGVPPNPHQKRRWAFVRSLNSFESGGYMAFTSPGDQMGGYETLFYRGLWLLGSNRDPAVLLFSRSSGAETPEEGVGREGDVAINMAANPNVRWIKLEGRWVADERSVRY